MSRAQNDAQNVGDESRQARHIGTYALGSLDARSAGYGASSTVPEAAIMCD
jgi:hypothetical protein